MVRVVIRFRTRETGLGLFLLWTGFWLSAGFLVLSPAATQWVAHQLGVGRGADATFYLGITTLFYLFLRMQLKIRDLEHQTTELVRKLALEGASKPERP
jgi:hypothetical protein